MVLAVKPKGEAEPPADWSLKLAKLASRFVLSGAEVSETGANKEGAGGAEVSEAGILAVDANLTT